jgi:hypothetical protein
MHIVSVYTLELDGNAVHQKFSLFIDLQFAEAYADRDIFSPVRRRRPRVFFLALL